MTTGAPWHFLFSALTLIAGVSCATADPSDSCDTLSALETFNVSGNAPKGATCTTFLTASAKTGITCRWDFPYRDNAAQQQAGTLWALLQKCRPGEQLAVDQRVNHPDSYYLREWAGRTSTYRVSQKDKAGLKRTIVFLRFERP